MFKNIKEKREEGKKQKEKTNLFYDGSLRMGGNHKAGPRATNSVTSSLKNLVPFPWQD